MSNAKTVPRLRVIAHSTRFAIALNDFTSHNRTIADGYSY
jgi:hypothetical protein